MKGLLLKDILMMRRTMIGILIIMPVMIIAIINMNLYMAGMFFGVFGSTFSLGALSQDGLSRWDIYEITLPVSRKQIISCKYLLLLGGNLIFALLVIIPLVIRGWLSPSDLLTIYLFFAVNLFFSCITLPLTYAVGTVHANIVQILVYLPVALAYFVFTELGTFKKAIIFPTYFLPISLIALVVGVSFSFLLSCIIFKNKEL